MWITCTNCHWSGSVRSNSSYCPACKHSFLLPPSGERQQAMVDNLAMRQEIAALEAENILLRQELAQTTVENRHVG